MPATRLFGIFLIVALAIAANAFLIVVRPDYLEGRRQRQSATATTPVRHHQPDPDLLAKEPQFPADPSLRVKGEVFWEGLGSWPTEGGGVLQAVDITGLTPQRRLADDSAPMFELWNKAGRYSEAVVDERVFTALRPQWAFADRLEPMGHEVGRVKLTEFEAADLARFLLQSGIIRGQSHLQASAKGTHYTSNSGDWFALHGEHHYATSVHGVEYFDFGIHIAPDGTIRLINIRDIGRPPGAY